MTPRAIVDERYYPDKHGGWSKWRVSDGFTLDEVLADDWNVGEP